MTTDPKPVELTEAERAELDVSGMFPTQFGWEHPEKWEKYTARSIGAKVGRIVASRVARIVAQGYVPVTEVAAREAAARREALLEAADWRPTRWWRAATPQGISWAESSDEAEVRERARPGDTIQRLYETVPQTEWRTALAEPERDEESGR